ncbi:hypothetical protein SDC9_172246 [bioreactor metagenome]|uniref:Uncharacterized protein n=1 Tax=bioreactor metagenome TaxID=1076179 RepID=A0A645GD54_9ZZZZ
MGPADVVIPHKIPMQRCAAVGAVPDVLQAGIPPLFFPFQGSDGEKHPLIAGADLRTDQVVGVEDQSG